MLVMGLALGPGLMVISINGILLYAKVSLFIIYNGNALLLFTCKLHCLQTFQHMSANWAIKVFVKFHIRTYLLGCLRY